MSAETVRLRLSIDEALQRHDKGTAVKAALSAVDDGLPIESLYRDVLVPILAETGAAWQRGDKHVWDEHLVSATVRTIVEALYPNVLAAAASRAPVGRSVLLACPPGEAHDLGLRMVADRFELARWRTFYLGADTPPDEIEAAARELAVDGVVLTSSTHFHRVALRRLVDSLKAALPGIAVWVGGPAFATDRGGFSDAELVDLDELLGDAASTHQGSPRGEGPAGGRDARD